MARSRDPLRARAPDVTVGWRQVCGWRLARQHVTAPTDDPVAVAAALGGVQAQVTSSAQFTAGLRSGATADELATALWDDRTLVRTWAARGTLHWLPAHEYALWVAALSTREWRITPGWERYHGVTADELAAITAAIPDALAGRCLTRGELAERLAEVTGSPHLVDRLRSGWGAVLKPAANKGLLCFGPDRGRNVTFVSPADWLGDPGPAPATDDAVRQVVHRFLDAYGPATHADFGRWFGVRDAAARRVLAAHADELAVAEVDGFRGWVTPGGAGQLTEAAPARGTVLLGGFDPYVLAPISHREALIPEGHVDDVSRTAGWISPVVLVDGFVAGTWSDERDADGTVVQVTPFAPLDPAQATAVEQAVEALPPHLLPDPVTVQVAPT